jgi:EmrB/QacA subfamily drug resistance transporter
MSHPTPHPHEAREPLDQQALEHQDTAPARRSRLTLALLCVAQFMLVLDITAVNVALPTIGRDLGIDTSALTWVITAYVVSFGGLMLLGGRLADVVGRRPILLTGLVIFTISSALAGLAEDGVPLIAGRAAQGVGAALISPAALASISVLFAGAARTKALGVWAGVGGTGFAAGLILSGLLTAGPGWPWIFLVNVPIGVILVALLARLLPGSARVGGQIDALGGVLVTMFAAALVLGLVGSGGPGGISVPTAVAFVLAFVALAAFLAHERRHPAPLMPLGVLRRRPVLTGLVLMVMASGSMVSSFFLGSMYLQRVLGLGALETGLAFVPAAVAITVSAHSAPRLLARLPVKAVAVIAFAVTAAGGAVLSQVGPTSALGYPTITGLVLVALGLGPAFVVATTTALSRVRHTEAGLASGIVNTGHEVGGAFGVAAMAAIVGGSSMSLLDPSSYPLGFAAVGVGAALALLIAAVFVDRGRAPGVSPHGHAHHASTAVHPVFDGEEDA